jgi:DNA-binding CsgD family transcriptional regulator/GAF domain-containing protein
LSGNGAEGAAGMASSLQEELTDAVYSAALDPAAWHDVVRLMRGSFPSTAQTFYFLDRETRHVRPVCLAGVQRRWLESFDETYFLPDNPWIQVTKLLHQPGVVRTTERLESFMKQQGVLDRSAYYNEWMRPQGFKHNIGTTLLADDALVANITLFRPPDMPTFSDEEVRAFEILSRHMTRSLRMSIQLERTENCPATAKAFDALPDAVALIDRQRRVLYANAAMETRLRGHNGLRLLQGEMIATDADAQQRLASYIACAWTRHGSSPAGVESVFLPGAKGGQLSLRAMPVHGAMAQYLPEKQTLLLTVRECSSRRVLSHAAISRRYGCTPAEARLAQHVADGKGVRQAAQAMGIGYGTARGYLKIVFQKTGARTQSQLVGLLLGDGAGRPGQPRN